ncbi:MAG: DUF72 domain-containing protein [Dehalococcoidia bacterium]|nr:DUF72 domain-containing protein [Dehalococcoidia bacterium]
MKQRVLVGCSGWQYAHWRGVLYPDGLPQRRWLQHYSATFPTVEVNSTFYRLPAEETLLRWLTFVNAGFVFAVKGSRFVTHMRRINGVKAAVAEFCARVRILGDALGPVLWQLPPSLSRDEVLLRQFVEVLPAQMRHAIEFRHESWWRPEVFGLLHDYGIALCLVDMPGACCPITSTAPFVYVRFHGPERLYGGRYSESALALWATQLTSVAGAATDLYVYFNNDDEGFAVENALTMSRLLGGV